MSDLIIYIQEIFCESRLFHFISNDDLGQLFLLSSTFSATSFSYSHVTNYAFWFTLKLAFCLVFLSAIKGGVPRYRYDFLTKIGWVKFLGLVITVFLLVFFLYLVF